MTRSTSLIPGSDSNPESKVLEVKSWRGEKYKGWGTVMSNKGPLGVEIKTVKGRFFEDYRDIERI